VRAPTPILAAALTAFAAACASAAPPPALDEPRAVPSSGWAGSADAQAIGLYLTPAWREMSGAEFERLCASWRPSGAPGALTPAALDELRNALGERSEAAVRAALLLGASHDPSGAATLLGRLELRLTDGERVVAGDWVAAAALGAVPPARAPESAPRLYALAAGERPHPEFVVRVECACSALRLGEERAAEFLLAVLREGTPAQLPRAPWDRIRVPLESVLLAQGRAARALAERAGVESTWRAEEGPESRAEQTAALARRVTLAAEARPR
jgi:hypothetical protein